jgi:hypothetical protein
MDISRQTETGGLAVANGTSNGNGSHGGNGNGNGANGGEPRVAPAPGRPDAVIRKALQEKTERVPLRALERRGFRSVQVLDMATIERIVHEAVEHSLAAHHADLGAPERAKLEVEAKAEFLKLLAEHKRVVAQKTEIERARESLEAQVGTLRDELEKQQTALRQERDRNLAGAAQFSLSPESFATMEAKIRKLFTTLISQERRMSLVEAGPQALRGLNELEREIAAMLDRLIADEREKYFAKERQDHAEKVDLLERRVEKLTKALSETEDVLQKVIAAKSLDPGIASIYSTVQGLAADALFFERKKELLKQIFEENLLLQKREVVEAAAQAAAATPDRSWAIPSAEALGFEPPLDTAPDDTAF